MNLKDWEKIEEDDHTVTMKHPSGHMMTIAVMALPKIQREQIRRLKLAEGGNIDSGKNRNDNEKGVHTREREYSTRNTRSRVGDLIHDKMPSKYADARDRGDNRTLELKAKDEHHKVLGQLVSMKKPNLKGLAHGGKVRDDKEHFANYNKMQVEKAKELAANIDKKEKENPSKGWGEHKTDMNVPYDPNYNETVGKRRGYDRGGGVQYFENNPNEVQQDPPQQDDSASQQKAPASPVPATTTININPGQQNQAPAVQAQPAPVMVAPQDQQPQGLQPAAAPVTPVPEDVKPVIPTSVKGSSLSNEARNTLEGIEAGKAGIQQGADIEASLAKAQVPVLQQNIQNQQQLLNQNSIGLKQYDDAVTYATNYLKEHPADPKAFGRNLSTTQKISTGIGLFLGGLGTPFGGHNFAFDMLNKQIDRDLQAQIENRSGAKTILGAFQNLFGNTQASILMAKSVMQDQMAKQIELQGKQIGTPVAQQKSLIAKQILMEKSAQNRMEAGTLAGSGGQGSISTKPGQPKQNEPKRLAPDDPSWGDTRPAGEGASWSEIKSGKAKYLEPGVGKAPKANEPNLFKIDEAKLNYETGLSSKGYMGHLQPSELAAANEAVGLAKSTNAAIKEIHKQFGEMFKNASATGDIAKYIGDQHIFGVHLPDTSKYTTQGVRDYMTAAAAVKKQIANVVAGGGSEELYSMIEDSLPHPNDDPVAYRKKLENVENILRQQVLRRAEAAAKYGIIK